MIGLLCGIVGFVAAAAVIVSRGASWMEAMAYLVAFNVVLLAMVGLIKVDGWLMSRFWRGL